MTLTAHVEAATSGSVTFLDGASPIGTAALDGDGSACMVTSAMAAGTHTLTASSDGPASAAIVQTVDGSNATYWFTSQRGDYVGEGATASYFTPTDEIAAGSNGNYVEVTVTAFGVPLSTPWRSFSPHPKART